MAEFTPTQGRYLSYIHAYRQLYDVAPRPAEIAEALGISGASVSQMLKTLEQKKLIHRNTATHEIKVLIAADKIPKWHGRHIERTVKMWLPAEEAEETLPQKSKQIYRFKITLLRSKPAIWRRIEVGDATLGELHEYIQTAMGWTDSHMHQFHIAGQRYTHARFLEDDLDFGAQDYTDIRISDLVAKHGAKLQMIYEYDFGDGWEHSVVLEKIVDPEPRAKYPRCTAGQRACPPEDIGGVYGYEEFLEAINDPEHERHEEFMGWSEDFDPEEFDPEEATRDMRVGLPEW
ncbi:MAG: IS1096 element passenger TnpR family protein [Aureliella sp.]